MQCKNHSDKEAISICQKFNFGFCKTCCEEVNVEDLEAVSCYCSSPNVHCKFRDQCIIYFNARKKSRELKARDS
ncbi:hypothetical protein ACFL20_03155 [Spirochaetota bacterium]